MMSNARREGRLPVLAVLLAAAAGGLAGSALAVGDRATVVVRADAGWTASGVSVSAPIPVKAEGMAMTLNPSLLPALFGASPSAWEARSGPAGQPFTCSAFSDASGAHPCLLDGAPYGALVGRVGARVFLIGDAPSLPVPTGESGELFLGVNENVGFEGDNAGAFSVHLGS